MYSCYIKIASKFKTTTKMKILSSKFKTFIVWLSITFSKFLTILSTLILIFSSKDLNGPAFLLLSLITFLTILFTYRSMKNWDDNIYKSLWPSKIETDDDILVYKDKIFCFPVFLGSAIHLLISNYLSN